MTDDQEYAAHLREHVDPLVPRVAVDTTVVVPHVRRRRATLRVGGTAALAVALVATGWMVHAQPWGTGTPPAERAPFVPVTDPLPTPTPTPTPTPAVDLGWPDAVFWYTLAEIEGLSDDGRTHKERVEQWQARDGLGLVVTEGDLSNAGAVGPASWGEVLIDGNRVVVDWDTLYSLPTDPATLGQLLRDSLAPDREPGADDDLVFAAATDLLVGTPASPALRTALRDVMTGLPGTTVTPGSTDATGRTGTLVERRDTSNVRRLVIQETTGRVLETSRTLENPPPPQYGFPNVLWIRTTYLEEGTAEDTPVEPTLMEGCASWEAC